jgi:hypothetical protein
VLPVVLGLFWSTDRLRAPVDPQPVNSNPKPSATAGIIVLFILILSLYAPVLLLSKFRASARERATIGQMMPDKP